MMLLTQHVHATSCLEMLSDVKINCRIIDGDNIAEIFQLEQIAQDKRTITCKLQVVINIEQESTKLYL